jgi:membrane protease YdiL (CAAX protease family)
MRARWGRSLRLAWRLFAFYLIAFSAAALLFAAGVFILRLTGHHAGFTGGLQRPTTLAVQQVLPIEVVVLCGYLVSMYVMARRERRSIADYWFPWRRLFARPFWIGAGSGLLAVSAVIGAMQVCGAAHITSFGTLGPALFANGALWAITFLFGALGEELGFRGYPLFALAENTSFWRGAVSMTIAFAAFHIPNQGETPLGIASVIAVGFLFCFALRRFGDLRWPIGFHAAWDWGQTALFGTKDSGLFASGSILHTETSGPALLSGGTAGPEATVFAFLAFAATAFAVYRFTARSVVQ